MYTKNLQEVFDFADSYERIKRFGEINSRHLLVGLANVESTAQKYLQQVGINKDNLSFYSDRFGHSTIYESEEIKRLKTLMERVCNLLNDNATDCIHLLLAILFDKTCYAYTSLCSRLGQPKVNQLATLILSAHPNKDAFFAALSGNGLTNSAGVSAKTAKCITPTETIAPAPKEESPAIPYGTDITQKAREGKFDPVIGRDGEIARIVQILSRRSKNNPVLVGEPGVGKSAVVEGLAQAIVSGAVPTTLQGKKLIELDIAGMVAGTRYRGDFEERLKSTLDKVTEDGNVILFIDEIHNLVGAGGNAESSMDAAEIMKPVLARGGLQTIGATTLNEYHRYIEKDPALERRFQQVLIAEPSQDDAIAILRGVKGKYEEHHGVTISDDAITSAVKLAVRYVNDRFLPDKAFDLIDEACSKVKISNFSRPESLTSIVAKLNQLKAQKQALLQGNPTQAQIDQIDQAYTDLYNQYQVQSDAYNQSRLAGKTVVTSKDVASVVAQWTGVPVEQISQSEKDKLLNLENQLAQRVIGQSKAVQAVSLAIRRQRAGLKDPNRPIGSFIFVGPTGVGKTELTKALAELLFGNSNEVIRLDMSEYMEKQSVSKLIGAPPGYVGFEESGLLTEKVHRKPYSVVLFDEVEKAHVDVFNLLLQILDEGRLTDSHGKTIDFKNTVIIMTSNVGADSRASVGFGASSNLENNVHDALKKHFRPEFLNRVDEIVVFEHLTQDEIRQISKLLCQSLSNRLSGTLKLHFTNEAIDFLARQGYDKEYGARPLKRTIQRKVEDKLAEKLLRGEVNAGDDVTVAVKNGDIAFVVESK